MIAYYSSLGFHWLHRHTYTLVLPHPLGLSTSLPLSEPLNPTIRAMILYLPNGNTPFFCSFLRIHISFHTMCSFKETTYNKPIIIYHRNNEFTMRFNAVFNSRTFSKKKPTPNPLLNSLPAPFNQSFFYACHYYSYSIGNNRMHQRPFRQLALLLKQLLGKKGPD